MGKGNLLRYGMEKFSRHILSRNRKGCYWELEKLHRDMGYGSGSDLQTVIPMLCVHMLGA
jgi:hypothetical protein